MISVLQRDPSSPGRVTVFLVAQGRAKPQVRSGPGHCSGAEHWERGSEAGSAEACCLWLELGEALAALGPGVRLATGLPPAALQTRLAPSLWASSRNPGCLERTKNPFLCSSETSVLPGTARAHTLPLSPALLNGYKLEDKSAGFQAVCLQSLATTNSQSSLAGEVEQERRRAESIGLCPPQTNPPRGPFSLDPAGEQRQS